MSARSEEFWNTATDLDEVLELVHAQSQLGHGRFEHLAQSVLLHQFDDHGERFLFRHLIAA